MKFKYTTLLFVLIAMMVSCTKDFEEINTNPNAPETTNTEFLMSDILISTAYAYQENAVGRRPASAARYLTLVRNTGYDLLDWGPVDWDDIYARLAVNKTFMETAQKRSENQYVAISKIMKAFNFAYLTDLYGDIPYSQALKSKEANLIYPEYDQQQAIYPDLLKELREANDMLKGNTQEINAKGDVMFKGKALAWRKFANSLRLRMLLRISKNYASAFTEMQEIVNDKTAFPIFESSADNAEMAYLGNIAAYSWPDGPLAMIDFDYQKTKVSKELVDRLIQRNDPRLAIWVEPVKSTVGSTVDLNRYVGVPNAIDAPSAYNGGEDHVSVFSSTFFRKNGGTSNPLLKASLVTYTEQCFILAEAAQRGKLTVSGETAESLYYKAIKESMNSYAVTAPQNYYDQQLVKYDGTLEQLITQKWLAMLFKGSEGWFDQRRTGYPAFVTGPLAAGRGIPKRYTYPDSESAKNRVNYQKAVSVFGADNQNTLMWYLK
ncbi:SusD/RagB family nutrient-binding outer membrane lipoprotein [Pedobacter nototheniae]|uniref:SusD/RagB family nutrient-binding outer membrane lipoprotein n=1 Tax=Pedobacter nototheniae TaxID=2488994 RepID=UPI00103D006A|nr:SusD/RagB family nutrient-binding outer membrane lipoprotein [Pedobacter nototheniae]